MRLLNNLYKVLCADSKDGRLTFKVKLDPDCFIYQTHFPGNPITPGVCLIQITSELLELEYHIIYDLSYLKNIKFKKIVRPGETVSFVFSDMTIKNSMCNVVVSVEKEDVQYAKMSMQFNIIKNEL